ncbi:MAG TPA: LLM class flavin-dependent oxidoreductase, partial [Micromonosporaceae bacterium]|nr:LLM class flavin-dependent oxidoreductase [Micromonosporaceae bacterium]
MTALGVVFRPQLPPERLRAVAEVAEEAGLEQLWLWEDAFFEGGISTACAALAWTGRPRVGLGLLPVPLRNVALTAMELASLERMFPGRFLAGIGHGVQDWMGQAGVRAESPMTLLREYLIALRALLRGERVTTEGRYVRLTDVALEWPPVTALPIYVGAVRSRTIRLAGELADGLILDPGNTPDKVRAARLTVDEARAAADRVDRFDLVAGLTAATGPVAADRVRAELTAWGHELVPELGVAGDADAVAEAVRRMADAGADTVVLTPTGDEPDPEGFVRFVA